MQAQDCNGVLQDISDDFTDWWSSDNSIAQVTYKQVYGVSPGDADDFASGDVLIGNGSYCTVDPVQVQGWIYVGPYQVEPIDTASQGPNQECPKGQAGWGRNVTNQVQFATGAPYAVEGLSVADDINIGTRNDLGLKSIKEGQYPTTGDGSFPDAYFDCSAVCPGSGETDALQAFTVGGIGLHHVDPLVYKCNSITIDGH